MRQDPDAYKAKVAAEVAETKKPEHLPPGFKLPNAGGAAAAEDFSYGSEEDGSEEEEDDAMDEGGGAVDASGLSAAENRIVGQVCEMGFDRAAVVRLLSSLPQNTRSRSDCGRCGADRSR